MEQKEILKSAVQLAYQNDDHTKSGFKNGSDKFWAGIITQVGESEMKREVPYHEHEPLALLGVTFPGTGKLGNSGKGGHRHCKNVEVNGLFALRITPSAQLHRSYTLLYIFAPLSLPPSSPGHLLAKVHR